MQVAGSGIQGVSQGAISVQDSLVQRMHASTTELREIIPAMRPEGYAEFFAKVIHQQTQEMQAFFSRRPRGVEHDQMRRLHEWSQQFCQLVHEILHQPAQLDISGLTYDEVLFLLSFKSPQASLAAFKTKLAREFVDGFVERKPIQNAQEEYWLWDVLLKMVMEQLRDGERYDCTLEQLENMLLRSCPVALVFSNSPFQYGEPRFLNDWVGKQFRDTDDPFTHSDYFALVQSVLGQLSDSMLEYFLRFGCLDFFCNEFAYKTEDNSQPFLLRLAVLVFQNREMSQKILKLLQGPAFRTPEWATTFSTNCARLKLRQIWVDQLTAQERAKLEVELNLSSYFGRAYPIHPKSEIHFTSEIYQSCKKLGGDISRKERLLESLVLCLDDYALGKIAHDRSDGNSALARGLLYGEIASEDLDLI